MAAQLVLRIVMATVTVIAVGAIAVLGFVMTVEPFRAALDGPPASLGWGTPGGTVVTFAGVGFIGLLLVLVAWMVFAPIRRDRRQQFR